MILISIVNDSSLDEWVWLVLLVDMFQFKLTPVQWHGTVQPRVKGENELEAQLRFWCLWFHVLGFVRLQL